MSWLVDLKNTLGIGDEIGAAVRLGINLLLGGALALYVRELYKRFGTTTSNRDAFANVFPMLTLTTIAVIYVVKSSLALSLGLVGALSIVRFRAAIKEPEELVFLFFCIAIGLALGADHKLLACVATLVVTAFVVGRNLLGWRKAHPNFLVTVSGQARRPGGREQRDFVLAMQQAAGDCTIQRFDVDADRMQLRAVVRPDRPEEVSALVQKLGAELPECHISYVNLETLV